MTTKQCKVKKLTKAQKLSLNRLSFMATNLAGIIEERQEDPTTTRWSTVVAYAEELMAEVVKANEIMPQDEEII
jgi:hypothetical protein